MSDSCLRRAPRAKDRVRHHGQQWPEAMLYGAGTVVRNERRGRFPGALVRMDRNPATGVPYEDWWAHEDLIHAVQCPRVDAHAAHGESCHGVLPAGAFPPPGEWGNAWRYLP